MPRIERWRSCALLCCCHAGARLRRCRAGQTARLSKRSGDFPLYNPRLIRRLVAEARPAQEQNRRAAALSSSSARKPRKSSRSVIGSSAAGERGISSCAPHGFCSGAPGAGIASASKSAHLACFYKSARRPRKARPDRGSATSGEAVRWRRCVR